MLFTAKIKQCGACSSLHLKEKRAPRREETTWREGKAGVPILSEGKRAQVKKEQAEPMADCEGPWAQRWHIF